MTDFHFFNKPTETFAGTVNPVFELLDFPIAMGGAEDIILTGPAPAKPLVGGREVSDPRLVEALQKPIELDRAEVLDRSAKLGGILRSMGIVGGDKAGPIIVIGEDLPPVARALAVLAAVRIGVPVDVRSASSKASDTKADGSQRDVLRIHGIEAAPIDSGRASVKVVRSRFEGVGATVAGQTANLDQAMRDSRVESAEVAPLDPSATVIIEAAGDLAATAALAWLKREVLDSAAQ